MFQAINNESAEVEGVRPPAHTVVVAPAATHAALDAVGVEAPLGHHALIVPAPQSGQIDLTSSCEMVWYLISGLRNSMIHGLGTSAKGLHLRSRHCNHILNLLDIMMHLLKERSLRDR